MLAAPLNAAILGALRNGARRQADLRREAGHPAQTTLRAQLRKLCDAGMIEKRRRNRFPGVLEYELSDAGRDLLPVCAMLERWLAASPHGELVLGSSAAKVVVKALAEGWSTTMLRALAARPLTLTELDRMISSSNYPSLERRLSAMRLAGLTVACESDNRGTPYDVTGWARLGAAPILAAARWERRHAPAECAPIDTIDVEAAFLLAVGLLDPPAELSGSCRLAVELRDGDGPRLAGLIVAVREGRVASRTTELEGDPDAWATGTLSAWLAVLSERDLAGLELGGSGAIARALLGQLHDALFAIPVR